MLLDQIDELRIFFYRPLDLLFYAGIQDVSPPQQALFPVLVGQMLLDRLPVVAVAGGQHRTHQCLILLRQPQRFPLLLVERPEVPPLLLL